MSKQKFMIYLLTTTLVLPTFTSSVAQAEENTKETKTSESNNEDSTSTSETTRTESNETPSSEDSTLIALIIIKARLSVKESQSDTVSNEDAAHSKPSSTHSKNNRSSHTKDEDTYHTPLSFNMNGSNHSFSSNF